MFSTADGDVCDRGCGEVWAAKGDIGRGEANGDVGGGDRGDDAELPSGDVGRSSLP